MPRGFDEIQPIVDGLAAELGRAVLVDDQDLNALCWSAQQDVDAVRLSSILRNTLAQAALGIVARLPMTNSIVVTDEVPEVGMESRVCAPLMHDSQSIGYLWVLDPARSLGDEQKLSIRAAADRIIEVLTSDDNSTSRRRSELLALLEQGHNEEAAAALSIQEHLPRDVQVVADLQKKPGDWLMPDGIAVRPATNPSHAPSGAPLPLADLGEAVRRARLVREAIGAGAILDERTYDALRSWRLLLEAPTSLKPADLVPDIDVLLDPSHVDLLRTADALFDAGGDVPAATAALHIHRTTFYYRLGRIGELLNLDMQDERDRTDLRNALRLVRIRSLRHS